MDYKGKPHLVLLLVYQTTEATKDINQTELKFFIIINIFTKAKARILTKVFIGIRLRILFQIGLFLKPINNYIESDRCF